MAVKYKVVSKRPAGIAGEREPRYYPAPTGRRTIDLRELSEMISKRSTFNSADVYGMAEMLFSLVPEVLQDGYNLQLGDFGTFSLSLKSDGQPSPEKVTVRDIKEVRMNFRPGTGIKRKLKDTKFQKVN